MHPDRGKSAGFFNKVMHLVRGNARAPQPSITVSDSLSARQVLQESMVRKRRNASIRKHEFAQLRLLRQRNEVGGQAPAIQTAKDDPLSSLLGQETRSSETLQKIDAIEAQMSGQWWRNPAQAAAKGDKPVSARKPNSRQLSLVPVLGEDCVVEPVHLPAARAATAALEGVSGPAIQPAAAAGAIATGKGSSAAQGGTSAAAVAVAAAAQAQAFTPHPSLEEAAILFAHGDLSGARTRLLEQLVQVLSAQPADAEKAAVLWHAVLDLCRATGDEEAFEPLAIDYAEHFGRSAPLWNSMPARLGVTALHGAQRRATAQQAPQWVCPGRLTREGVAALRQAQSSVQQPWSMSWLRLAAMDEAALEPLVQLLQTWADSEGHFVLSDAGKLLQLLAQHTVVGERQRAPQWWLLHMAVLRWMHRMEAYEQVALDYCVTYEVSPPSWLEPHCTCVVQEEGEADISILQTVTGLSSPQEVRLPELPAVAGLSGVVEGDPQALLDALTQGAQPGQELVVACDYLIRLDFVAAGSVLNWAAEMQNQGYTLRFTQLHQLVAVFFCVIGIHEHAKVQATIA